MGRSSQDFGNCVRDMDARTHLDSALFQLTPTRTRCDLIIVAGDTKEKIVSGLVQPFVSHLKVAKDQYAKGGYSIILRPPSHDSSFWFTKVTLQSFVTFVSTPEVLERFFTIENEILQIESSIRSNEQETDAEENSSVAYKNIKSPSGVFQGETNGSGDKADENCRHRLQGFLETRKAMLQKEQAMVYARALVSGFGINCIDDLFSFADAFGASRLREACINFLDLCNKKNNDRIWMDEVAAMQACSLSEFSYVGTSGIILAGEANDPNLTSSHNGGFSGGKTYGSMDASVSENGSLDNSQDNGCQVYPQVPARDTKGQVPIQWLNRLPHHINNFQAPLQQMPPCQGYIFPGTRVSPSCYSGNMTWSSHVEDSDLGLDQVVDNWVHKPNSKEGEFLLKNGQQIWKQENRESSDSQLGSEPDDFGGYIDRVNNKKKHRKKSSRKIVIRNINYITSDRNEESGDASPGNSSVGDGKFIDGHSLSQEVEEAVSSFGTNREPTSQIIAKRSGSKQHRISNLSNDVSDQETERSTSKAAASVRRNENWDIFQNLLLKDAESRSCNTESLNVKGQSEEGQKHDVVSTACSVMSERETRNKSKLSAECFDRGTNVHPVIKKQNNEEVPFLREESGVTRLDNRGEPSPFERQLGKSLCQEQSMKSIIFNGEDYSSCLARNDLKNHTNKKDNVDDSFMLQPELISKSCDSPRTDVLMVSGIFLSNNQTQDIKSGKSKEKVEAPDDLLMVLKQDLNHSASQPAVASWNPEIDYRTDSLLNGAVENIADAELICSFDAKEITGGSSKGRVESKEAKSKGLEKSNVTPRQKSSSSRNKTTIQKRQTDKEEEKKKKKMEELLTNRQRRISERTVSSGLKPVISNRIPKESKSNLTLAKNEKEKLKFPTQQSKIAPNPILRNSTIDRLAASPVSPEISSTKLKGSQRLKPVAKINGVVSTSLVQKRIGTKNKKPSPDKLMLSDKKSSQRISNRAQVNKDFLDTTMMEFNTPKTAQPSDIFPTETNVGRGSENKMPDGKSSGTILGKGDPSAQLDYLRGSNEMISKASPLNLEKIVSFNDVSVLPDKTSTLFPSLPSKALESTLSKMDKDNLENEKSFTTYKISAIEASTPSPNNEINPVSIHSRKKWSRGDHLPKAAKGFRKLLLFGQKS